MADVKTFVPAPDRAPPSNAVGAFAWVRDNLFGSIGSSVATLLFFYLFTLSKYTSNPLITRCL